ncbi:LADA_0B05886g1_1 [Lachancea dasiensis]|uniref:LADA_0B05886g1_1 n=1 Tax=Lachancea dasiensis TaxID=1072105 RepID=A0A1G4ITD0_9SACH|nr:LADA_0B05886g1_1 [Lachancea dasiensis]
MVGVCFLEKVISIAVRQRCTWSISELHQERPPLERDVRIRLLHFGRASTLGSVPPDMKFSHSLQFNAVPEWSSRYLAYSQLKRLIYSLQKDKLYQSSFSDPELVPLQDSFTQRFVEALDKELYKIDKFYHQQESRIFNSYQEVVDDLKEFQTEQALNDRTSRRSSVSNNSEASGGSVPYIRHDTSFLDDEVNVNTSSNRPEHTGSDMTAMAPLISRSTNYLARLDPIIEDKINLKKRLVVAFTQLSELKSFIELNQTGFSKICKKFDKSLETRIKSEYIARLSSRVKVFKPETIANVESKINDAIGLYASLMNTSYSTGDEIVGFQEAEKELSMHLREHVVWERNTVWKDMINLERQAQNVKVAGALKRKPTKTKLLDDEVQRSPSPEALPNATLTDALHLTPAQYFKILIKSNGLLKFTAITFVFLMSLTFSPIQDMLQKNCFAILVYASLLWATETIPLFVTSLLVPLLIVVLPVLKDSDGHVMDPQQSSQYILSTMWSSVIMLLLGGFTLAAALSKYNVAKVISTHVLASAGTNPKTILLTNMCVALFVSMWVSNVAAPVLCYSIIQPLLRTLPKNSSFAKSLILGIALASNVGGMASPIASPQNIISIGMMDPPPSWEQWFIVALPVCCVCVFGIWVMLLLTFPVEKDLKLLQLHPIRDPFTIQQWFVTLCTIGTIVLWCMAKQLTGIFGEMGVISIIPIVLLFGTGMLTSSDFNNFMWTIIVLAMGGTTLGKAVTSSGLLAAIAASIKEQVEDKPIFVIVLIFGIVILVMATFVSHTVAAMIIVPLMSEIGKNLPSGDHSRILVMVAALLCSGAMGLPTSGFPNVTAISMIDELGDRYLTVGNFITRGVPASIWSYLVITTIGYGLMKLIGY